MRQEQSCSPHQGELRGQTNDSLPQGGDERFSPPFVVPCASYGVASLEWMIMPATQRDGGSAPRRTKRQLAREQAGNAPQQETESVRQAAASMLMKSRYKQLQTVTPPAELVAQGYEGNGIYIMMGVARGRGTIGAYLTKQQLTALTERALQRTVDMGMGRRLDLSLNKRTFRWDWPRHVEKWITNAAFMDVFGAAVESDVAWMKFMEQTEAAPKTSAWQGLALAHCRPQGPVVPASDRGAAAAASHGPAKRAVSGKRVALAPLTRSLLSHQNVVHQTQMDEPAQKGTGLQVTVKSESERPRKRRKPNENQGPFMSPAIPARSIMQRQPVLPRHQTTPRPSTLRTVSIGQWYESAATDDVLVDCPGRTPPLALPPMDQCDLGVKVLSSPPVVSKDFRNSGVPEVACVEALRPSSGGYGAERAGGGAATSMSPETDPVFSMVQLDIPDDSDALTLDDCLVPRRWSNGSVGEPGWTIDEDVDSVSC